MTLQCSGFTSFRLDYQQAIYKGNLTVTKVAPANTASANFQKTYSGNPGDTFVAEESICKYLLQ
ncbi:MAG: hypothetical protein HC930_14520 [Hydrococcus sp. SU_1_0]|nr:hypothetical protein [Hydrococcus sp. SU_1_0]